MNGQAASPGFLGLVPILVIFAIFYLMLFLPMRRRQKKHQELLSKLTKGDRVVTSGGIFGTIVSAEGETIELRVADNVKLQIARNAIAGLAKDASDLELKPGE